VKLGAVLVCPELGHLAFVDETLADEGGQLPLGMSGHTNGDRTLGDYLRGAHLESGSHQAHYKEIAERVRAAGYLHRAKKPMDVYVRSELDRLAKQGKLGIRKVRVGVYALAREDL